MRVSSALKYAFAWGVQRWPPNYDRGSAFQRIQPGQTGLPTRTCRALRRGGIPSQPSAAGYSACWVPPFASDPWAGTWRSGSESTPDLLPRGESPRSGGAVEDRVRQRGNSDRPLYGGLWNQAYGRIPTLLRCLSASRTALLLEGGALPCLSGNEALPAQPAPGRRRYRGVSERAAGPRTPPSGDFMTASAVCPPEHGT